MSKDYDLCSLLLVGGQGDSLNPLVQGSVVQAQTVLHLCRDSLHASADAGPAAVVATWRVEACVLQSCPDSPLICGPDDDGAGSSHFVLWCAIVCVEAEIAHERAYRAANRHSGESEQNDERDPVSPSHGSSIPRRPYRAPTEPKHLAELRSVERSGHSQRRPSEPQGIGDYGHRAERHGRARDHRAEQQPEPRVKDACGNRHPRHVVNEREE